MAAESGNLVFLTGSAQNIEFRTGSLGKIKLNNEDLGECLHQVKHWKYTDVILHIHLYDLIEQLGINLCFESLAQRM
jgi:hypothetical protein